VLHVFPHWNWQGKEGEEIPVRVYSNCDEVELFLNEKSLGKKKMEKNGHLEWQVPYAPGKLEARGSSQGKQLSAVRETTGEPAGIVLEPDRSVLTADGADLAWVGVSVVDDHGRVVPTAGNKVRFSVSGPAKVLGVGNGNPTCHESVKASQISAFNGLCMVLVQTTRTPGDIVLTAESDGLKPTGITLKSK
jgi:beta-galactosidase